MFKSHEIDSILAVRSRSKGGATSEPSTNKAAAPKQNSDPESKTGRRINNQQKQIENLKNQVTTKGKGKGKKNGKAKSKAKGSSKAKNEQCIPDQLSGLEPKNEAGDPFCFNAALGKCNKAKCGDKCANGWHRCMQPG